ncbi:PhoH family protein [Tepidimicrobium xylanilyticum]|uniref:PhoH-like protein n=1 Tax=Tepidimicrobium xylanilyticum TaxID=1123352 RepID=A0A1H2T2M9_9FIRM|nr:PhoH family protein [Tepidimicrobium xylanilyticum]GMG96043.1 phosphate starvation protein PhoH [Tepidimicrobium xylanilyticum]SDW38092.1 phosphate starvation-inducible protein PhoH [Tepidimicrobium xylanilyticum]
MEKAFEERQVFVEDNQIISQIFGQLDENVNIIKKELGVELFLRDGSIVIKGEGFLAELGERLVNRLIEIIKSQRRLTKQELRYTIQLILEGKEEGIKDLLNDIICITASGKSIKPKTLGQKRYVDSIKRNDIVFGIGPAGTGKTYLAMAMAVNAFKNKEVNRIILTRPAVEAGESLGFLPGDLQEKVDPYLRPIYDALFDILGGETYMKLMEKNLIEVAPLAYMRGRTLDSAYVILDEAQNTTNEQMKMFLTRLGFGSKAIITGDVTQIDLSKNRTSGLVTVQSILSNIEGIDFVYLTKLDIVRHPLVQRIIAAYEKYEKEE